MDIELISNRKMNLYEEAIKSIAKKEIVLDLGSGSPCSGELKKYKKYFYGSYYGMDINSVYHPHILGDIQELPFKNESASGIICGAVLEHIPEPQKAVREMNRILKKNGEMVVYLPFLYPYHGGREFKDYYRFTYDAILYMFRDFKKLRIQEGEGYIGTTMRFMVDFSFLQKYFLPITNYLDSLILKTLNKEKYKNKVIRHGHFKSTTGYMIHAIK